MKTETTAHKTRLTFGLNSTKSPLQVNELVPFEEGIINLVKYLRFGNVDNKFQRTFPKDLEDIRLSNKPLTATSKTSNMYRLSKEEHSNLFQNATTPKYKSANKQRRRNKYKQRSN